MALGIRQIQVGNSTHTYIFGNSDKIAKNLFGGGKKDTTFKGSGFRGKPRTV
jgi:hypothetical protein